MDQIDFNQIDVNQNNVNHFDVCQIDVDRIILESSDEVDKKIKKDEEKKNKASITKHYMKNGIMSTI